MAQGLALYLYRQPVKMSMSRSYHPNNEDEKVLSFEDIDASLTYSYAHYLNWLFEDRVELIKGQVFKMSPAPSRFHQEVSGNILKVLFNYLENKSCKVYAAPFDVRFPRDSKDDKDIYTVLQPDICIICDQAKLDDRGCIGAPDVVVEILSPGNNKMELLTKYNVYQEFEVKEYWVVSLADKTFLLYTLDNEGQYQASKLFSASETVHSTVLSGFELNLEKVFKD
jgi:Uma2 family endonuclease